MNHEIRAQMIRVIDDEGKMIGLFQVPDAIKIAFERGLDLIEIAPDANPPTCKIMDMGKYKYELKKKAQESKKKQVVITIKEVQFRPNTDKHDIETKVRHIQKFLGEGDKCRVIVTFKGREMSHTELGRAVLDKIIGMLGDTCVIEQPPLFEGKRLGMLIGPGAAKPVPKKEKPQASGGAPSTGGSNDPGTPKQG